MQLSDVTAPFPLPGPPNKTKFVAYGASVLNDNTSPEAIRKLGAHVGCTTRSHPSIRIVECVLFGTGHGKLPDAPAAKSLAKGFMKTADPAAELWIFVHGSERHAGVQKAIESGFVRRIIDSVNLSPGWMGVGVNLKKLFRWEK